MSSSPKQRQTGTPHPGARPLHSEELDGFWQGDRDKEIINRGDYLVRNHLEVPPHIIKAYYKIKEEGLDWCRASETTICRVIDSLPPRLFESQVWRREDLTEPCRVTDPAYYDIMQRISRSEQEFLSVDRDSASTRLLENIREPASTPHSFKWHLKQAGVSIDRIFNFTNSVCKFMAKADGGREPAEATWPILQFQNQHRRKYLMKDMARYLRSKPNGHSELPHTTFFIPDTEDPHLFLEEGILKINARTLVYDTTHNNNLLKLLQEVDIRPGVIIKQFTFWRDGDDAKTPEGKQPAWR
ncbi:hypothetical protein QBC35DRAFT_393509 [Podospora australis]|uniref:Uncharacterized protein n=1 Tax=Podospora australis TaxID=1536484 RepID=A0AAN6WKQ1_9PEZI|nr:hypothetical protein QBC35DRAFT_393509 [Podospora australis]